VFSSFSVDDFRVIGGIPHLPVANPSTITTPQTGMLIYSIVDACPMIYTGSLWENLCTNNIGSNTLEDYFVVKEGISYLPVKTNLVEIAPSGSIYYSVSDGSTMISDGSSWIKLSDMGNSDFPLNNAFSTQGANIKTCKFPVLDNDPAPVGLSLGAIYINKDTKTLRYYDGAVWKDIACSPMLRTLAVTSISNTSSICGGNLVSNSGSPVTIRGICWDTKPHPDNTLSTKTTSFDPLGYFLGEYTCNLTYLKASTTYYVCAYASNSSGVGYGEDQIFTTAEATKPTIITLDVSGVTSTKAYCGGKIVSNGGASISARGICWSNKPHPTVELKTKTDDGSGVGEFPSSLADLFGNTIYYVRAYAINKMGIAYGNEIIFTTSHATFPILSSPTISVSDITDHSAKSEGTILSNGGSPILDYGICWSIDRVIMYYGESSALDSGTDIGHFTCDLTDLQSGTTYYVYAYATNTEGTAYSSETAFITSAFATFITKPVTSITGTTANSGGIITSDGRAKVTDKGICWSTIKDFDPESEEIHKTHDGIGIGDFTSVLTGLTIGTTYYVKAYAVNDVGIAYGNEEEFTTDAFPFVQTKSVDLVTRTTAVCKGEVGSDGRRLITERGVCWSINDKPDITDNHISSGANIGDFECSISGLTAGTTYYVCTYAINCLGIAYGGDINITTEPPILASLSTVDVSKIEGKTATSGGTIINNGGVPVIDCGICWSVGENPTIDLSTKQTLAVIDNSFTGTLTELDPNIRYYVRAYVVNSVGISYGNQQTFVTAAKPSVSTISVLEITGKTVNIEGDVIDNGRAVIIKRGFCWSTQQNFNPFNVSEDNRKEDSKSEIGVFTNIITGLTEETTYYVRAYAANSAGIVYGEELTFTTASFAKLTTTDVTDISRTSALGWGQITDDGGLEVTERGICWDILEKPTVELSAKTSKGVGTGDFASNITNLIAGTTYYVRAYAITGAGVAYGNQKTFITAPPILADISTKAIRDVKATTAVGEGIINNTGGVPIIAQGFCWSIVPKPTIGLSTKTVNKDSQGVGDYIYNVSDLKPNTIYYIRAYATNIVGTIYGEELSFTTLVPELATVITTTISDNNGKTAISGGNIINNGGVLIQERGLCWSTSPNPTVDLSQKNVNGSGIGDYSSVITNLQPGTIYYVRAYATSIVGISYGNEIVFKTPSLPIIKTYYATSAVGNIICGGDISSDGGAEVTQWGIYWSINEDMSGARHLYNIGINPGSYAYNIPDLKPNTLYFAYAYAINSVGKTNGEKVNFLTPTKAILITNPVSSITRTTAKGGGNITSDGRTPIKCKGICWSLNPNPDIYTSLKIEDKTDPGIGSFTYDLTDLIANTDYYVRAYAINNVDVAYGNQVIFRTQPAKLASLTTTDISSISNTEAVSGGEITDNGGALITQRGVCWSIDHNPTVDLSTKTTNGSGMGNFMSNVTDLTSGTTYYIRAYATSAAGTAYGDEKTFTTEPPILVSLSTDAISSVTCSSFVCGGNISDTGGVPVTVRGLCWSTNPNPTVNLLTKTEDNSNISVGTFSEEILNLTPSTTYYVRAYATNSVGTAYGEEYTVTMLNPTLASLSTNAISSVTCSGFVCGGNISDTGGVPITMHGLCWSTNPNPTVNLSTKTEDNSNVSVGNFSEEISKLTPSTTYYVRAYATNSVGTAYGEEYTVTMLNPTLASLSTDAISSVTCGGFVCGGNISNTGGVPITVYGFCWSTNPNPTVDLSTKTGDNSNISVGDFSEQILNLTPSTTYYVCAYATNSVGTAYGEEYTVTTLTPTIASLSTVVISLLTDNSAVSGGIITNTGGITIKQYGVCWSTSPEPTTVLLTKTVEKGNIGVGSFSAEILNLTAGTVYYVRAYAINDEGTAYGNEIIFTTSDLANVTTSEISSVTSNSCKCGGSVIDDGNSVVTQRGLCWSTSADPTFDLPIKTSNGSGTGEFVGLLTSLKPITKYYVRAYAKNAVGIAYGTPKIFTTSALLPTLTTTNSSVLSYNSILCGGEIISNGGAEITERGICYSSVKDFNPRTLSRDSMMVDNTGTGIGSFSLSIGSLDANKKYYMCAYATNSAGTAYGNQINITIFATSPELNTNPITDITGLTAISGGDVISDGGAAMVERGICWSTDKNPVITNNLNRVSNGKEVGEYTCKLTGLEPNTPYYVRAYAINAIGTAYGKEILFITNARPTLTATISVSYTHLRAHET